jgi:hypothetical protein
MNISQKIEHICQMQGWQYLATNTGFKLEVITRAGRTQIIHIDGITDPEGRPLAEIWSTVCELRFANDLAYILRLNQSLVYGALAIRDQSLVMRSTQLIETADVEELRRIFYFVALQADDLERQARGNQVDEN